MAEDREPGAVAPPDGSGDVYLAYRDGRLVAALRDDEDIAYSTAEVARWQGQGRCVQRVSRAEFRAMSLGAAPAPGQGGRLGR